MRACMHALCCAHSRSSLRCAHGCQELFPSPHTALWRHQHRSHRAVAARTARAHTARARAAGRGPSTHTPTTNRTSTPRTQHGHTGVRSAKRTGAGSAVPRPCLRSLAAVGRRHLPTCATWAPCVWRWPGAWPWRNAPRARPATPTPCTWKQPHMVTHHPPMDRQRGLKLRAPVLAVSRRRAPARRGMLYSASASIHRARTHTAPLFQSTRPQHPGTRTAATTTRTFATGSERAPRGPGPPCAVLAPP